MKILITGSVGCGKTSIAKMVATDLDFLYLSLSEIIIDNKLYSEFDEVFNTHIVDDDKLLKYFEQNIIPLNRNIVVDHHSFDIFGNRFFDAVFVVKCDPAVLRPRLVSRDYSDRKIAENIECEIMQVVADECQRFKCSVVELVNETMDQLQQNVQKIEEFVSSRETLKEVAEEEFAEGDE